MELPSMVQRSGDTLIVRSVVSGNQLYADQQHNSTGPEILNNMNTSTTTSANNNNGSSAANGVGGLQVNPSISNSLIMEQIECLKRSQEAAQQLMQQHHQQLQQAQQQQQQQAQQNAAMELKEEGLPQCKIKRNYSCSYCTYFTQNPRYHLTHLRDVHGEKIVINKCKLCLYASRHYQKLVRHMKMVHGCTEGVTSGHGQARGKRGMNRERKRKLEENMPQTGAMKLMNLEAFNAEQEEQQKSQQLSISAANAFIAAYEQQLRAQRDLAEKDALRKTEHSTYERRESTSPPPAPQAPIKEASDDANYTNSHAQQKCYDYNPSSSTTSTSNNNNNAQQEAKIQIPPQRLSYELTPSPSGSNSSPPPAGQSTSGSTTPLSVMLPSDEPSNNRLLKCSLCDFTTLYRNNLLEHEIEDHCDAKFYRCEKCSYVTHIKARFSKHVKYHSMPMIKCVTCDFRTPYKWNLDRHMKNHGGAGPFRCAACDFTADIKQSLTVHEMNHHVPPVGHAAGMTLARRRNKVGGTDLSEDFFSDSAEMMEDHFNNNNMDEYDEMLMTAGPAEGMYESKRFRYEEDEPTDLSQKGGSSDTSSVHNQSLPGTKAKKPLPNLIPISKEGENILNLSSDMATGGNGRYFNEKQISEMLQPLEKPDSAVGAAPASQLSPTTTIASSSAASGKSLLARKSGGSFFDKIKFSNTTNENLICPCGHMAKCLSESIIHRKSCTYGHDDIDLDDEDHDEDGEEGRLEIDFNEDDECDKQSQSALNLSVTGSTRCQHCRHRCKSSADLLNHLKICSEANSRCGDSLSGESSVGSRLMMGDGSGQQHHPMENRVFVWNKLPRNQGSEGSQSFDGARGMHQNANINNGGHGGSGIGAGILSANNDENSYYGVETAPGYGEVTKKMTPEEEAANSSLKKVYKCPHCSFWASTASRFHVHIVGHLNKKPFECSLCSYRSNWRWDITKHIRLKTIRDPSHKNARVLMNDETGRRNYTKYNKYITLMKVTEEDGDPKLMKSGEMTPNQVASLAFINDYNQKQQQHQGSVASSGSTSLNNILNGVREDITLEPIPSKNSMGGVNEDNMADNFIRLPLLASMMNAAMAQQQHQKGQQASSGDHENATLITPSVTISAVKKSQQTSAAPFKPSDEIILEVRPDSNEKNYKCRKCNFRHMNRDAVLAHVKVHFPDPNAPIVTATATTSPNKSGQLQATGPLQVSVNSNLYMNKVLAAMCLTQQPNNSSASAQAQLTNLVAAGLLDQSTNSPLSGLALALAGKSPLKASQLNAAAANIIEHGEQKAILNDQASAENTMTSPNQLTLVKALQHNSQQQQQEHVQATSSNCGYGSATATTSPSSSSSLQNLLTSPRGVRQTNNTTVNIDGGLNDNTMVMGSPKTTTTTPATTHTNKSGIMATSATAIPPPPSPQAIVTTTTSTPISSPCTFNLTQTAARPLSPIQPPALLAASFSSSLGNNKHFGDGHVGENDSSVMSSSGGGCDLGDGLQDLMMKVMGYASYSSDHHVGIKSSLSFKSSNPNQTIKQNQNSSSTSSATSIQNHTSSSSSQCNSNNNNNNNNSNNASNNNLGHMSSGNGSNNNNNNSHHNNNNNNNGNGGNGNNNNNNNLLTHETTSGDRRDPSPYRCGHCHQVSNWKHVIQRHCRLKHAGVINIETLDRAATGERHMAPVYKPLVNGATINDPQQQQHTNNNNVLMDNTSKMLVPKSETPQSLLNFPLPLISGAGASQDLHAAAAAYLAEIYKAAAAQNGNHNATLANITNMAEELLLQQQLQKNDQIEITRVSSSSSASNANKQQQQQNFGGNNNKSKQQKCPLCTYICDSKSQMNYHISLHKPTQYECHLCTFVCAKKQHLSSHMRSVHQMLPQQQQQHHQQQQQAFAAASSAALNMDFSLALKMAAAAKNQQDSPLAIDLSGIKHNIASLNSPAQRSTTAGTNSVANANSASNQHLPPEYQYRLIYYCNKCPARYAQKHNDPQTAKTDLDDHLRQHEPYHGSSDDSRKYQCEYCDYRAAHETLVQAHRYVHTSQYQEKCNELYKNCKDDTVYRAPKLMHITATRNNMKHETIWVVDQDLNEGHIMKMGGQNSSITSSSPNGGFEVGNSLLKKQLESKQNSTTNVQEVATKDVEDLASVSPANSDMMEHVSEKTNRQENHSPSPAPENVEKCQHCPFESTLSSEFKTHIQQHISVSQQHLAYTCEHCDYTADEQDHIDEHTRIHFNSMEKLKDVAFFTSYDKLELSMEQPLTAEENEGADEAAGEENHLEMNIKKEVVQSNNNNDEDRINENLKQSATTTANNNSGNNNNEANTSTKPEENKSQKCAKIILYKNDGCLSIKKENNNNNNETEQQSQQQQNNSSSNNQNISDRLRRRISRQSGNVMPTNTTSNNNNNNSTSDDQQQQQSTTTSHKTILVNAKTGQVISRN
ncbi:uncharacterized protein LOC133324332 [Musca vetustissima]|uniref:uncharacterized protein LOC133324332 n=1 Tax=Musca vetustissima TaxID=27455 RepID=UPI002AB74329|nr:uncharacterized protein LOC133324332 [Musca vetustissima]